MSNVNYTPGPWAFERRYFDGSGSVVGSDGKSIAAIASSVKRPPEEKAANAALLAAAPEMLEALQLALRDMEYVRKAHHDATKVGVLLMSIEAARAAIAKATGG